MDIREIANQVNTMNDSELATIVSEIERQKGSISFASNMLQKVVDSYRNQQVFQALNIDYEAFPMKDSRKLFVYAYLTINNEI